MKLRFRSDYWSAADINLWTVAICFAIALLILFAIFSGNRACLLMGLDGTAWVSMFDTQEMARAPFSQTGAEPLQGGFDAYYPAFREFAIPSLLAMPFSAAGASKVATYVIYAALMIIATYALACWAELCWRWWPCPPISMAQAGPMEFTIWRPTWRNRLR
jgi:hypothetical protein